MHSICNDNLIVIYEHMNSDVDRICLAMTCKRMWHIPFRLTQFKMSYKTALQYSLRANLNQLVLHGQVPPNFREYFPNVQRLIYTSRFAQIDNDVLRCESFKGDNLNFISMGNVRSIKCNVFKIKGKQYMNQPIHHLLGVTDLRVNKDTDMHVPYDMSSLNLQSFTHSDMCQILPDTNKLVRFRTYCFNDTYEAFEFSQLRTLKTDTYVQTLCPIPKQITKLYIDDYFDIDFNLIPHLHTLNIDACFGNIENVLALKTLYIRRHHEKCTNMVLPDTLEYLHIQIAPQLIMKHFPAHLKVLKLDLRKPLKCAWPMSLEYLELNHYNYAFKFHFPSTLKTIQLNHYNQSIHFAWPAALERLILIKHNKAFKFPFPSTLRYLELNAYTHALPFDLPDSLHTLKLGTYNHALNAWPSQLRYLTLGEYNQYTIWPSTLKILKTNKFDQVVKSWPKRLIKLRMNAFNQSSHAPFSSTLQVLHLSMYNQEMNDSWPASLKRLSLTSFNQPLHLNNHQLQVLTLNAYNRPFDEAWPTSLRALILGSYNHEFTIPWPEQLHYLSTHAYNCALNLPWPSHLRYLRMDKMIMEQNCTFPSSLHVLHLPKTRLIEYSSHIKSCYCSSKNTGQQTFANTYEYYMY